MTEKVRNKLVEICDATGSRVAFDEDLSTHSTISVGGKAKAWFVPSSLEALREAVLFLCDSGTSSIVVGNGSNVLMPDNGLEVAINLDNGFFVKKEFEDRKVLAGAGVDLGGLISDCCLRGLSGIEGLVGIPATVGGALATNASYKTAISDCLESVRVMNKEGNARWVKKGDIRFGYRSSSFKNGEVIVEAVFNLAEMSPDQLKQALKANFCDKKHKQPLGVKTLGCIFKNPEGSERKAGELIELAGMKGASVGDAQVSQMHANFIVNSGNATARDVIVLIEEVRQQVFEKFSIALELEIEILDTR
ncbi:MAG: UDP-N-acetylmuramate dehydrogenase [Candidatus Omnitrophota bacterium]